MTPVFIQRFFKLTSPFFSDAVSLFCLCNPTWIARDSKLQPIKITHFFSGRARDTGKLKRQGNFWLPRIRKECAPEFKTLVNTSSRVKSMNLLKCLDKLEQEMCWNNVIWSLPVNEHSPIHCSVYVVMLLHVNSFFSCFFFLSFEFSSYMVFKFRVIINFARIYFRRSFISHFFFSREKREIMHTNKKYNKANSCFCLSSDPHTFHARFEFWQNYFNVTQRDLYSTQNVEKVSSHQRRKMTIFLKNKSAASLEKLSSEK